jgi:hypothetical protein
MSLPGRRGETAPSESNEGMVEYPVHRCIQQGIQLAGQQSRSEGGRIHVVDREKRSR